MKPDEFAGNIVIRPSADVSRDDPPAYHGAKCEEDTADGGGRVVGNLSPVGRVEPELSSDYDISGYRIEPQQLKAQKQLEEGMMPGECCGHSAFIHSKVRPFICRSWIDGVSCLCKGWDSGE
jgi:hypothetical protein